MEGFMAATVLVETQEVCEKAGKFKEKFQDFFGQKKKVRALSNLASSVVPKEAEIEMRKDKAMLDIIKKCLKESFLDEEEIRFLAYMMKKRFSQENYLDYTHRTKWLKDKLVDKKAPPEQLDMFDWNLLDEKKAAPFEMLVNQYRRPTARCL
jgi:hypothetical protein